jgi:hypothetical protein
MANPSSGLDVQIAAIADAVKLTLGMIASQDQRVGAKVLYKDNTFIEVVRDYYLATLRINTSPTAAPARAALKNKLDAFVAYVQANKPLEGGILTQLRRNYGRSFSELYKNSLTLQKLLEAGVSEEANLEALVVPDQQSSPIYTKVEGNRIVLDSGQPLHPLLRKEAMLKTRQYLRQELVELTKALQASNVDRKYVDAFSRLHELIQFDDDSGAIAFALHSKLMSHLTTKIESELSDVLSIQISSTLTHSAYFAAQYKDWIDFVHNAQNYPPRDILQETLEDALANVTNTLESNPDTVDRRIPESIRMLMKILLGNLEDRIQGTYASVRAIENFCIAAIRYSYDEAKRLVQDAASKARPAIVNIGAAAIIIITLNVITSFMPVIKHASELSWILENLPKIERIGKILAK